MQRGTLRVGQSVKAGKLRVRNQGTVYKARFIYSSAGVEGMKLGRRV